ncbi:MAG: hypothetical protein KAR20_02240 [Candidatus Heimdallarchaeota archaeon]|nr:hypothetical protein [Candidatus Heimdallarchaeota archaeon]
MKKIIIISIFCVFISASCAFQKGPTYFEEDYEVWFEKHAQDGLIKITTNPEDAYVYLIEDEFEDVVSMTPASYKVKVTGRPFYFRVVKEGYYNYKIQVLPTPLNPIVDMNIELKKIVTSLKPEIETADDMNKISEHRNLNYNSRIVG